MQNLDILLHYNLLIQTLKHKIFDITSDTHTHTRILSVSHVAHYISLLSLLDTHKSTTDILSLTRRL